MTDWVKEKEQASQELKDNRLFQGLFEAVIKQSEEIRNLKTSIDNLREINNSQANIIRNTKGDTNERKSSYEPPKGIDERMKEIITLRETTEVVGKTGRPVCYFCKDELCRGWPNKHVIFSCSPKCALELEKVLLQSVYKYWKEK